jgi:hypothetical protein
MDKKVEEQASYTSINKLKSYEKKINEISTNPYP